MAWMPLPFHLFLFATNAFTCAYAIAARAGTSSLRAATLRQEPFFDFKVAHIVSPLPGKDAIQSAVLRSYSAAKLQAESWDRNSIKINVTVLSSQVAGEEPIKLPIGVQRAPPLNRTTASEFGCRRTIPFASDLMRTLQAEAPTATLYILSNADIAVTPEFYQWVATKYLAFGAESMNILKVMIPHSCDGVPLATNLTASYQFARRQPQTHPGSDMFVWKASKTSQIMANTGDVFFGYPPVGQVLYDALIASSRVSLFRGEHVTFHYGSEGERGRGDPGIVRLPSIPDGCTYEGDQFVDEVNEDFAQDCDYLSLNFGEGMKHSRTLQQRVADHNARAAALQQ